MYQDHFGLTRELFRSNPEGESPYVGPQQLATIARLRKALATPEAIVAVTGPVGVGKSIIAGRALEEIAPEHRIARIGRMRLGPDEVLELLLESFSITRQPAGTIQRFAAFKRLLRDFSANGTRPFILVEDTRRIGTDALLEIEALTAADTSGAASANIILLGDSELDTLLADPSLARVKQRIRLRHTVAPFAESDTEGYLRRCVSLASGDFDCIFASGTVAALHACSGGIPRVLNNIGESVLTEAADSGVRPVTAALVTRVARDVYGIEVMPGFAASSADEHDELHEDDDPHIAGTTFATSDLAESKDAIADAAPGAVANEGDTEAGEHDAAVGESALGMEVAANAGDPQPNPDSADAADRTEITPEAANAPVDELAERRLASPSLPVRSHQDLPELGELLARIGATRPKPDTLAAPEEGLPDTPPETAAAGAQEQAAKDASEIEAHDGAPVNTAEPEQDDPEASAIQADADVFACAPPLSTGDDLQEPLHVADDDDTLEAAILDAEEIPSIDEVPEAPLQQEQDWQASDDDIPVLTTEMHAAAANDEENAASPTDAPGEQAPADHTGEAVPVIELADIDDLELALSSTNDVIEKSSNASRDDARLVGAVPEITLDKELEQKKAPAPASNLSRWQEEIALANGLEDISDVLAETVFGDKAFDELAARVASDPGPDERDGQPLVEKSRTAVPARSVSAPMAENPAATASQQDSSGAWKFDMSVSRRFELVKELGRAQKEREINAHSMVEITLGEDGHPVDASQGPVPEPIEAQIDTEITQSRMALKPEDIEKLAAKEEPPPEPEKESRGLFGLFRPSTRS